MLDESKSEVGVTADEVRYAYNFIFCREPESKEVIEEHRKSVASVMDLRKRFMDSDEFRDLMGLARCKLNSQYMPERAKTRFNYSDLNCRIEAIDTGQIFEIANKINIPTYSTDSLTKEFLKENYCRVAL